MPDADDDSAVVMLHGMGSCHSGSYMSGVCAGLLQRGVRTIRLDLPGAGPSCETTDLPPHAGSSPAVLKILEYIAENLGYRRLTLVGFSLGGAISLHLAATAADKLVELEQSNTLSIEHIFAFAPPLDLAHCCKMMEHGFNRVYAKFFLRGLRRSAANRARHWASWRAVAESFKVKSIRQFDDYVTAPLAGFHDADEYYEFSSVHKRLDAIQVPTTIVADRNDPICPYEMFDEVPETGPIELITTNRGGHLGYFDFETKHGLHRWADSHFAELIASRINPSAGWE